MTRILFLIIGFILIVIGLSFNILYLNLLTIGYNFSFYVHFITRRIECYCTIIGFLTILLALNRKGDKKNDLHL